MFIGIDVGASKINAVLLDEKAKIIKKIGIIKEIKEMKKIKIIRKIKIATPKNRKKFLSALFDCISFLLSSFEKQVQGIGIAVPGIIERKNGKGGKIIITENMPFLNNFDLRKAIEKKFSLKTKIENDAKCFAIAEFLYECKNAKSILCLTLGTGVGGGIIINKKIYLGKGNAPEPGHITIEKNGLKCSCGSIGCLEEYASAKGIVRIAKKFHLPEDAKKIQEMAVEGNKKAIFVYKEFGKNLGIGISNIIKVIDPELIVLGGGLTKASHLFLSEAIKEAKKRTFFRIPEIRISKLEDAGAIGAAMLCKNSQI